MVLFTLTDDIYIDCLSGLNDTQESTLWNFRDITATDWWRKIFISTCDYIGRVGGQYGPLFGSRAAEHSEDKTEPNILLPDKRRLSRQLHVAILPYCLT